MPDLGSYHKGGICLQGTFFIFGELSKKLSDYWMDQVPVFFTHIKKFIPAYGKSVGKDSAASLMIIAG